MSDWQPDQYLRFRNERTQPAIDLAGRIEVGSPRRVVDIGCGPGNSTAVLRRRWPDAEIVGVDSSASMLEKARAEQPDGIWMRLDVGGDLSGLGRFDVVFSNAALQWIPDHDTLLPNLFGLLDDGGALAVQVPFVRDLPVFAEMAAMAATPRWAPHFPALPEYPKHFPFRHYYDIVCRLSPELYAWRTDYLHIFSSHDDIVEWYKGSGLRPFLDMLPDGAAREEFRREYGERIGRAYPAEKDGGVILPFTRIFFLVYKR